MKCSHFPFSILFCHKIIIHQFAVVDGWDICIDNIGDAMRKAQVLDIALQDQVYDKLSKLAPRPSIYDSDFIAANQVGYSETEMHLNTRKDK